MIIAHLLIDSIVQINDLTRLDASGSRFEHEARVFIKPDADKEEIEIGSNQRDYFLDYAYSTSGEKEVTLRIDENGSSHSISKTILVVSKDEERLFSNDERLRNQEQSILRLLPAGRNSFIYAHRLAQKDILRDLAENGRNVTKEQLSNIEDVCRWATYRALHLIYESNIQTADDLHIRKSEYYRGLANDAKNSAVIRIDTANGVKEIKRLPTGLRLG